MPGPLASHARALAQLSREEGHEIVAIAVPEILRVEMDDEIGEASEVDDDLGDFTLLL